MRLLISNDDGVMSDGITSLARAMSSVAEVYVVAPDRQRSASSHGISLHRPLHANAVDFSVPNVEAWSFSGTPVDCVKWAIYYFQKRNIQFDLVLSGINHGYNLATDVLYSGTVAAAGEAALQGLPAIALSLGGIKEFHFHDIAAACSVMIPELHSISLPPDTFLSINFPTGGSAAGRWCATRLGARGYRDYFIQKQDENGQIGYHYAGEEILELNESDTDIACVQQGNISVTPLRYRFTNDDFIGSLKLELKKSVK